MSTTHEPATAPAPPPSLSDQVGTLLAHLGGYVAVRTVEMGLRHGLIQALAAAGGDASGASGLTAEELAKATGLDPFYVEVWCRAAVASELVDPDGDRFVLAPHMGTVLLDKDSPVYVAGPFLVFECPDTFDRFSSRFATGQRMWWDECTPEFNRRGSPLRPGVLRASCARRA